MSVFAMGIFDVTAYGALGDNSTDDTSAINTAIAALNTAGGGVLLFPAKSAGYKVTSTLTALSQGRTIVQGPGPIRPTTAVSSATGMFQDGVSTVGTTFRDLQFNSSSGSDVTGLMISLIGDQAMIDNCTLRFCSQPITIAPSGGEDTHSGVYRCRFMQCNHSSASNGNGLIDIQSGQGPVEVYANHFSSCNANANANDALINVAAGVPRFFIRENSVDAGTFNNGVTVRSGSSDKYVITDNDFFNSGSVAVNDLGTGANKAVASTLIHYPICTATTANSAAISNTETVTNSVLTIPANAGVLRAGTIVRFLIQGTCSPTAANTTKFTFRAGTAGTTADASVADWTTPASSAAGTAIPFTIVIEYVVRTTGTPGTGQGLMTVVNQGTTGIITATGDVEATGTNTGPNTSTPTKIVLTAVAAAATTATTYLSVVTEILQPVF